MICSSRVNKETKMFWTTVKRVRNGLQESANGSVIDKIGGLVSGQSDTLIVSYVGQMEGVFRRSSL